MLKKTLLFFISFTFSFLNAQEICDNGIDDDGNGLIDLNDQVCNCNGFNYPQTVPSLIPNPSFEDYSTCPTGISQMNRADNWVQATNATSDYFNCSFVAPPLTGGVVVAADGTGFVGTIVRDTWKECVGTCLISPLQAGETYLLSLYIAFGSRAFFTGACNTSYGDLDITIYGSANCGSLPLSTYDCPTSVSTNWVALGSETYTNSINWEVLTIEFTPTFDVHEIIIGPPCNLPSGYTGGVCVPYFFYDDLTLATINDFNSLELSRSGSFCTGDLSLSATADSTGGTWQWYYDGIALLGETSSTLDVTALGNGPGKYTAKYTKGTDCETEYIILDPPQMPIPDFHFSDVCLGETMVFSDSSEIDTSGGVFIDSWRWSIDTLDNSISQDTSYHFTDPGTYDIQLFVEGNNSCKDSITQSVVVHPSPIADFEFDTLCNQIISDFTNLSTVSSGVIDSWNWNFDDGNTSSIEHPINTFVLDSIYNVQLIVETTQGCRDTIVKEVIVYPIPNVDFETSDVCLEEQSDFIDLSTISNLNTINSIVDWSWDFGDGTTSSVQNPNHVFDSDGVYNVNLMVVSNHGCEIDTTKTVIIHPLPEVSFIGFDIEGCSPICPDISSTTIINSSSSINSLTWTLSNGSIYTGNEFTTCFESLNNGSNYYDVILTAISNQGCVAEHTENDFITVHHNPIADFEYEPEAPTVIQSEIEFFNTSQYADTYEWTFGSHGNSTEVHPMFEFPPVTDQHFVILVAKTHEDCMDTIVKLIDLLDEIVFYIPNTFTPDNDLVNQVFQPVFTSGFDPQYFTLTIYNRWGELIFESNDATKGWDGTYGVGSNRQAQPGIYTWKITFKETMSEAKHTHTGHVNLMR
ncbi:PKD domain-containing protein [Brumimicrobium aurantiacum]|uniref:PKD domain-containing protein n=1 Tax=Brumimicrobium aurantiacum TaxID=1737063 RepID=A0A3E1EW28_9FLAO|nr:PKD domain-containing protein [Brumimicrobium aurantiacum]RFC53759.1 PKD domain-containing protein [Brumimicrobium aurantiacum]